MGADCGSYHALLIAKFRLKLKKVGKTTKPFKGKSLSHVQLFPTPWTIAYHVPLSMEEPKPFRYDLNQIPNDYTVKVRKRFKGLDLIDRVPDELWTEVHDIVQETGIKTICKEKKHKKANCCLRRPYK